MGKKIFFQAVFSLVLLASIFILPLFYPAGPAVYIRLLLLLLLLGVSLKGFKATVIDGHFPSPLTKAVTVIYSLFVTFILLEAIFMFIPQSHSVDYSLASKLWYAKYWKPINALGYRDHEPHCKHPAWIFVGDSFTAGHGIKSIDKRFSNLVEHELNKSPQKHSVITLAQPNWDTKAEYDGMMDFIRLTRIHPEKIILQYFGNDIEGVAMQEGLVFEGFHPPPMNRFVLLLGAGSYLFNYLYFLFPRESLGASYIAFLCGAYQNRSVLSKHKKDLLLFVDFAKENHIPLSVIVFPFLNHIELSDRIYVRDIVNFFQDHGAKVINVSLLAKHLPPSERTVNKNDSHASEKLHQMIAQKILETLR